ncbi:MAG: glycosyltransferase family 2 protein [Bacteroidales bacterium]|nr:glycosyltransferase family 2 protein [Bacteroidales bacterium]
MDISIIIPAYNEGRTIEKVIDSLYRLLSDSEYSFQLIVVDDGSKDDTKVKAQQSLDRLEEWKGVFRLIAKENGGKGSAIRAGIPYAEGDYIIIQDADLENDPHDILRMLQVIKSENLKVLYGSRFLKTESKSLYPAFYWGGRAVTLAANVLFGQRLTDEPTCYKMFSNDLLKSIDLKCKGFEFCPEVTAKVAKRGYKIKEIPISYFPRTKAEGKKVSWKDGVEALWVLLKYRFVK